MESADVPKPSDGDGIVGQHWPDQSETVHQRLSDEQREISQSCQSMVLSAMACSAYDPSFSERVKELSDRGDAHLCLSVLLKAMSSNILVAKERVTSVLREFRDEQERLFARTPDRQKFDAACRQLADEARQKVSDLIAKFRLVHDHLNETAILISGKGQEHG